MFSQSETAAVAAFLLAKSEKDVKRAMKSLTENFSKAHLESIIERLSNPASTIGRLALNGQEAEYLKKRIAKLYE